MAQAVAMGPPLSPRETRRSGRRSLPSASTSASKSPDSDPPPNRPSLTSTNSSGRQKRLKQEDYEDPADDKKNYSAPSVSSSSSTNTTGAARTKRKSKDKDKDKQAPLEPSVSDNVVEPSPNPPPDVAEEEEQGITRCVCGSTGEDDPDAGEFMVQCETCKVWQHGLCMGFESEDQLYDDDYYCEECKPELHTDLLKKRSKRPPRQPSANSHHNPNSSRISRSHSPSTLLKQPSKRRNTMNSRDAAFDESLKEIIEATAAEAAAAHDNASVTSAGTRDVHQSIEDEVDLGTGGRKKRKRVEEDSQPKKRTRSASTASDHPGSIVRDGTPGQIKAPISAPSKPGRSNKRGGKKAPPVALNIEVAPVDGDEAPAPLSTTKRQGNSGRTKSSQSTKRPPASHSQGAGSGDRRGPASGSTGQTPSANEAARAYRNSHAYAVSQQPLYTSWNLPDYLAHLEHILPTEAPQPLEVRGSGLTLARGESVDHSVERGVKIKWPAKRMSVGDMNKRVRALVEWVGREQAGAQDRSRRKNALAKAYEEEMKNDKGLGAPGYETEDRAMVIDEADRDPPLQSDLNTVSQAPRSAPMLQFDDTQSSATMKQMEELMEELIRFQERLCLRKTSCLEVIEEDGTSTLREPSPVIPDNVSVNNADEHLGDYSAQMDELFNDVDDEGRDDVDDEEDEGFLYTGVDAPDAPIGYRERLRDVLGSELTDDDAETNEEDITLAHGGNDDEPLSSGLNGHFRESILPSETSMSSIHSVTPPRVSSPGPSGAVKTRSLLPPSVSRLRSYTPLSSQTASNGNGGSDLTSRSRLLDVMSPSPSHFSSMSRNSSRSDLRTHADGLAGLTTHSERDVFRWTNLKNISEHVFNPLTQKLSSVLGTPMLGSPSVLAVNGLICVGTDQGKICVYDFKQKLKCICVNDTHAYFDPEAYFQGKALGPVTALALSHDHTYVAAGHASGHIQLFDLRNPKAPARFVPPTTLEMVASGRKEGHIEGSRIVSINFVAGRHTAIISSDDHGLAFSHSLGKMLFVEAPDILRILGQYQSDSLQLTTSTNAPASRTIPDTTLPRRHKSRYAILASAPLPLSTPPHATDNYNVIAMLTPSKLVVVALKPSPRTWFKCPRDPDEGLNSKTRGTLAWSSSVIHANLKPSSTTDLHVTTPPLLAFTWGCALRLIRVNESRATETMRNSRTGKKIEAEVGRISYEDIGRWTSDENILAAQWLNVNVLDVRTFNVVESVSVDGFSLISPSLASTVNGTVSYSDSVGDVSHSIRVYKGKIFLLCRNELRAGTLLTWADRILSFVEDGDFLSAIDLTRLYYLGLAPGNRNGLPEDPILRKEAIGEKMRDLMVASANYAFSEDRMTDGTHVTPDGRGVDRTSLFEGLMTVSCRASIAMDDYDFLFEDLFQRFDDNGISKIFVRQLEPFVLSNDIRYVPPRITQQLVTLNEEDNHLDRIERLIWHIDPACLDINQIIRICQRHRLYDALIYVYTRALCDFVAPVVELLDLVKQVKQLRRSQFNSSNFRESAEAESALEPIILNAYKVYPYLSNVLSGLSYPSEDPLPDADALRAKQEVYAFLFLGHSGLWPPGEGSRLILTAEEEGGIEPTYPYVNQLLRFDAESFLHTLDIAFEDPFLNDESHGINRLIIVRILLEILSAGDLSPTDSTFVNIFIARNVPKYPQFLPIPPSSLHDIIIGLAEDFDPDTREDRQLATEYLLSAYNPHESDHIVRLFESAGFYRILRTWYRHEHQWAPLLSAYLHDSDLRPSEVLSKADEVLTLNCRTNKDSLTHDVHETLSNALPQLLHLSLVETASLLDKHAPDLHEAALQNLPDDLHRFSYLRHLLGPPEGNDEISSLGPSSRVTGHQCQLFITLQCQQHPEDVIRTLKYLSSSCVDWDSALLTCENERVYDAVVWATDWRGDLREALQKGEAYQKRLTQEVIKVLDSTEGQTCEIHGYIQSLVSIAAISVAICLAHSQASSKIDFPLEDMWFQLLSSQINSVQALSLFQSGSNSSVGQEDSLATLRALIQRSFASLVSVTTTQIISFPRLFKRLVESAPPSIHAQYTEFRTILKGMLESYRSEGDMLVITKHLVDRDLFETMEEIMRERNRGWSPYRAICTQCLKPLLTSGTRGTDNDVDTKITILRTGRVYHATCSTSF
ncbi:hypothetical protein H0H92_014427 [Tricholoma furcatifolium]|nr:hypothetical protein H0H92_014427 [Tricholoma furcatifolium]